MKCGYCGRPLKKDMTYCTYCGHKIDGTGIVDDKRSGGSSLLSVIVLVVVIATSTAGCARIFMHSAKGNTPTVSSGDILPPNADNAPTTSDKPTSTTAPTTANPFPSYVIDNAVCGSWICTDKTLLGYGRSDFGVDVTLTLTLDNVGGFEIDYKVINTGLVERETHFNGTFTANKGSIEIKPFMSSYDGRYFSDREIKKLSLKYSRKGAELVLTDDNGVSLSLAPDISEDRSI